MKFFKDTFVELKRVSFPSRKQITKDTILVISVCAFSSLFVFGADTLFQNLLTFIINL